MASVASVAWSGREGGRIHWMHGEVSATSRQATRGACVHVRAAQSPIARGLACQETRPR